MYIVVAMFGSAELSIGEGETLEWAMEEAQESLPEIYKQAGDLVRYEVTVTE